MSDYAALTIFGAAKCTLECNYCYIKKTDDIKEMDKEIVKWLHNPVLPDSIDGKAVTILTLWGGEPSLHLDVIANNIDKYKKILPNLKSFTISSNMSYPKHYDVFAKMIVGNDFTVDIQISDDSELFNEVNRGITSKVIQRNALKLIELLTKYNCDFTYHFKSTTNIDNFKLMYDSDDALNNFFTYFDDFAGKIKDIVGDDKFNPMATSATIVCPGAYTKSDGIIFNNYLTKLFEWLINEKLSHCKNSNINLNYPERWTRQVMRMYDFTNNQRTFTCSAGDSNIQIDSMGGLHPCHRPLFFVYDNHLDSLRSLDSTPNDDVEYLKGGLIDVYKKYYSMDHEKMKLHMRSYHDNYKHRMASTTAIIMEAALCGQIDKEYQNKKLAEIFAIFIQSCCGCPIENFFVTSSWHLTPISIIRLFGNGAFNLINNVTLNAIEKESK